MNTLVISDKKKFDQEVWQTETEFTEKEYNKWLQDSALDELQRIYDTNDGDGDVYVLGDVINLLRNTKIKVE